VERVTRPIAKYLAIIFVALLLIAFVPAITLVLPRWLGLS
jgi:TRAP-type C4-dicarboxylate transport system permease large subunit